MSSRRNFFVDISPEEEPKYGISGYYGALLVRISELPPPGTLLELCTSDFRKTFKEAFREFTDSTGHKFAIATFTHLIPGEYAVFPPDILAKRIRISMDDVKIEARRLSVLEWRDTLLDAIGRS